MGAETERAAMALGLMQAALARLGGENMQQAAHYLQLSIAEIAPEVPAGARVEPDMAALLAAVTLGGPDVA